MRSDAHTPSSPGVRIEVSTAQQTPTNAARAIGGIWVGAIVSALAAFATQVAIARLYGVEAVGILITSTAIATIVAPLALFGTHWFENDGRVIAHPGRWRGPARVVFLGAVVVGALLAWMAASFLGLSTAAGAMTLTVMLGTVAVERAIAGFQVAGLFGRVAAVQPAAYLARLAGIVVAAGFGWGIDGAWWAVAFVLAAVLTAITVRSGYLLLSPSDDIEPVALGECVRELAPLVGIAVFAIAFSQIDRLFVSARLGQEAAGLYGAAVSLLLFAEILPGAAANRYLLPRLGHADAAGVGRTVGVGRVVGLALIAGLAVAIAYFVLGPFALTLLFGTSFEAAAQPLMVLAWYLPGRFVTLALGPFFLASGRKHLKVALDAAALALLCVALWLATGENGLRTVSFVKPIAETFIAIALLTALRRGIGTRR